MQNSTDRSTLQNRGNLLSSLILALAIAASVSACGGGGSGSAGNPTSGSPPVVPEPVGRVQALSGAAFKGLIRGASVEACEIGAPVSRCATGRTDTNGRYSLTIQDYRGGPATVTVRGGVGATVRCDVAGGCSGTPFGADMPLTNSFSMRAAVPELAGANASVPITPFTDIVAQLGGASASGIRNSANAVGNLLGNVNVLTLTPRDITVTDKAEPEASDYALFLAGVAATAPDNPMTALTALRDAFSGGAITGKAYSQLVKSALEQSTKLGIAEQAGLLTTAKLMAQASGESSAPVTLPPPTSTSEISIAKDSVAAARKLIDDASSLEQPLLMISDELRTTGESVGDLGPALDLLLDGFVTTLDGFPDLLDAKGCARSSISSGKYTLTCQEQNGSIRVVANGESASANIRDLSVSVPKQALPQIFDAERNPNVQAGTLTVAISVADLSALDPDKRKVTLKIDTGTITLKLLRAINIALQEQRQILDAVSEFSFDFAAELSSDNQRAGGTFNLQLSNVGCPAPASGAPGEQDCDFNIALNKLAFTGLISKARSELKTSFSFDANGQSILFSGTESAPRIKVLGKLLLEVKVTGKDVSEISVIFALDLKETLQSESKIEDVVGEARLTALLDPSRLVTIRVVSDRAAVGKPAEIKTYVRVNSLSEMRLGGNADAGFSGGVYVGDKLVATVSRSSNRTYIIRYADGSFESLL